MNKSMFILVYVSYEGGIRQQLNLVVSEWLHILASEYQNYKAEEYLYTYVIYDDEQMTRDILQEKHYWIQML